MSSSRPPLPTPQGGKREDVGGSANAPVATATAAIPACAASTPTSLDSHGTAKAFVPPIDVQKTTKIIRSCAGMPSFKREAVQLISCIAGQEIVEVLRSAAMAAMPGEIAGERSVPLITVEALQKVVSSDTEKYGHFREVAMAAKPEPQSKKRKASKNAGNARKGGTVKPPPSAPPPPPPLSFVEDTADPCKPESEELAQAQAGGYLVPTNISEFAAFAFDDENYDDA